MDLLRDRRSSMRFVMLMEILERKPSRIRTLAEAMDLSVQGASDYLKGLEEDGLVVREDGEFRLTTKGVQVLHEGFSGLRDFVEDKGRSLEIVGSCLALAGNRVREGDSVGLRMEGGELVAYSGADEPSSGSARSTARKGELVRVGELRGVVDLSPGKVHLFRVDIRLQKGGGGTRKVSLPADKARKAIASVKPDVVGAAGTGARALLVKAGRKADFSLSPYASAAEAAGRGLRVLLFVDAEDAQAATVALSEHRVAGGEPLEYGWV